MENTRSYFVVSLGLLVMSSQGGPSQFLKLTYPAINAGLLTANIASCGGTRTWE